MVANHMLYHLPQIDIALREIRHVLKQDGRLVASTIGRSHLGELKALANEYAQKFDASSRNAELFGLETGLDQLQSVFCKVRTHPYLDKLVVTEAKPLADYIVSTGRGVAVQDRPVAFQQFLQKRIDLNGAISIGKDSGLFCATP